MMTNKIVGLVDPTQAQDAATKNYVDSVAQGLSAKESVRVGTTAAGTLATSFANGETVDGITLATDDRIMIKDQASASENGVYVVQASGAPVRALDMDAADEFAASFFFIEEGTINADSGWVCTNDGDIVVDSDSVEFSQFSGAGQVTAGYGMTKTGNTLDVVSANGGIVINNDDIELTLNGGTLTIDGSGIKVSDLGVDTDQLAGDAVNGDKIADDSIDSEHYVDGSIDLVHMSADSVNGDKIADNSIDSEHYVDGSIDTDHIADNQVTVSKLADGTDGQFIINNGTDPTYTVMSGDATLSGTGVLAIGAEKILNSMMAADSVDSDQYVDGSIDLIHLSDDSVDGTKIVDDTIDSEHYVDGSIDNDHLSNDAVTGSKLDMRKELTSGALVSDQWTLTATPVDDDHLWIFMNGQALRPTDDYTLSGATITFLGTPLDVNDKFMVYYMTA